MHLCDVTYYKEWKILRFLDMLYEYFSVYGGETHLQFTSLYPRVRWKFHKHRDEILKTCIPVPKKKHQQDKIEDAHELASNVEKLT